MLPGGIRHKTTPSSLNSTFQMLPKIAEIGRKRPGSIAMAVLGNAEIIGTDSVIFIKLHVVIIRKVEVKNIDVTLT